MHIKGLPAAFRMINSTTAEGTIRVPEIGLYTVRNRVILQGWTGTEGLDMGGRHGGGHGHGYDV